jgi:GLPGLI family protein
MKTKSVLLVFLMLFSIISRAQKMEGEIIYERVFNWTTALAKISFLTKEQKDRQRMVWGDDDESKSKMRLVFNEKHSFFSHPKEHEQQDWSDRDRDYSIYRDFEKGVHTDIIEMLGKTYIVEDSLRTPKWKVMNKIRDIGGYVCMMAVAEDTIKNQKITAWFTGDIPVSVGPELYYGLPGVILELDVDNGALLITAIKIDLKLITEDINVPKKIKGKKITNKQYDALVSTHMRDSEKAQRLFFRGFPY